MCVFFSWDNGEIEKMSPWDLEPVDDSRKLLIYSDFFHVLVSATVFNTLVGHIIYLATYNLCSQTICIMCV